MSRDPRYDVLFEPIAIGPKTLRNRFFQVPHANGFGSERPGAQLAFRGTRAEGGWAAVSTEFCSIHPESDDTPFMSARLWDDEDVEALTAMCDEAHRFGALAAVELWHGGPMIHSWQSRQPPAGPSQLPVHLAPYGVVYPRTMDRADIHEVQQWYVDAALRAVRCGFDIVYVYGAYSYLPLQFLSREFNVREDEYGGSLENRARFWLETLERVRAAIGETTAVAARISIDALGRGGIELDEGLQFIRMADHLVDLWDVNVGSAFNTAAEIAPSRVSPEYYMREWTREVKKVSVKPVLGVGRFVSPDLMVDILRKGELDIIGAARPSIADPFLPRKIEEGRLDDIRECIGCNLCLQRAVYASQIACTQNATAGEEYRRGWHPERFTPTRRRDALALVVGGGAAGLECARVLGERGLAGVQVVDAQQDLGGYARMVGSLPGLGEWMRVVAYRETQIGKLANVVGVTGRRLSDEEVLDYGADVVVVATGSSWSRDGLNHVTGSGIPGSGLGHVLVPEDLLREGREPQGRVLVYDCDATLIGPGVAELLAARGCEVTLVSPLGKVAPYADQTSDGPHLRRQLRAAGVRLSPRTVLEKIGPDSCTLRSGAETYEQEVDAVVLVTARVSDDGLYRRLRSQPERLADAGITTLVRIGDCIAPRSIAEAVFDGHRMAREIDGPDPRVPLPFLRERPSVPVIGSGPGSATL